jgi:hypothetical protein
MPRKTLVMAVERANKNCGPELPHSVGLNAYDYAGTGASPGSRARPALEAKLLRETRLNFWIHAKIRLTRRICDARRDGPARHRVFLPIPVDHMARPLVVIGLAALVYAQTLVLISIISMS